MSANTLGISGIQPRRRPTTITMFKPQTPLDLFLAFIKLLLGTNAAMKCFEMHTELSWAEGTVNAHGGFVLCVYMYH